MGMDHGHASWDGNTIIRVCFFVLFILSSLQIGNMGVYFHISMGFEFSFRFFFYSTHTPLQRLS